MVFLSLLFWALVIGPLGAILGVPLTMAVRQLFLAADDKTRWIADLMGAGVAEEAKADSDPMDS